MQGTQPGSQSGRIGAKANETLRAAPLLFLGSRAMEAILVDCSTLSHRIAIHPAAMSGVVKGQGALPEAEGQNSKTSGKNWYPKIHDRSSNSQL